MKTLKIVLKKKLRDAKKIALLGVGSELRGDDVAGMLVARLFDNAVRKVKTQRKLKVFFGETAPENFTGEIKKFKPTHLVIVDSADLGKRAGAVKLLDQNVIGGYSFCTHQLPIKIMVDYLVNSLACKVIVIGIQPKRIDFTGDISEEVKKTANVVVRVLRDVIIKNFGE